jgi:hypothetical protein
MRGKDAPPDWSDGRHRETGGARQGVGSGRGAEQTSEGVLMGETGPQLGVGVRAVAVVVTVTGGAPEGLMVDRGHRYRHGAGWKGRQRGGHEVCNVVLGTGRRRA